MNSKEAKNYLNKLNIEKKMFGYDQTGVENAIQALDNMYSEAMAKELSRRDEIIKEQEKTIADLEQRLDKAADFCVATEEENEQLIDKYQNLAKQYSEINTDKEMAELEANEDDRLIKEYLEELLEEKEELLDRVKFLSDEIRKQGSKQRDVYSMWKENK